MRTYKIKEVRRVTTTQIVTVPDEFDDKVHSVEEWISEVIDEAQHSEIIYTEQELVDDKTI